MNKEKNKIYKQLKNSPLYNLSLCSKEEFHSAFFVWFLNLDLEKNIGLFFKNKNGINNEDYQAYREIKISKDKNNKQNNGSRFDIVIGTKKTDKTGCPDQITHVIENKFKCFYSADQINKYNEIDKIKEAEKLMLIFFNTNFQAPNWSIKTYQEIVNDELFRAEDAKNNLFIDDYKHYIKSLLQLIKLDFHNNDKELEKIITQGTAMNEFTELLDANRELLMQHNISSHIGQFVNGVNLDLVHQSTGNGLSVHFLFSGANDISFYNFINDPYSSIQNIEEKNQILNKTFCQNKGHCWLFPWAEDSTQKHKKKSFTEIGSYSVNETLNTKRSLEQIRTLENNKALDTQAAANYLFAQLIKYSK